MKDRQTKTDNRQSGSGRHSQFQINRQCKMEIDNRRQIVDNPSSIIDNPRLILNNGQSIIDSQQWKIEMVNVTILE